MQIFFLPIWRRDSNIFLACCKVLCLCRHIWPSSWIAENWDTETKKKIAASKKLGRRPVMGGYKNFLLERGRDHQGHHAGHTGIIPKKLLITQIHGWILKKFRAFIVKRDLWAVYGCCIHSPWQYVVKNLNNLLIAKIAHTQLYYLSIFRLWFVCKSWSVLQELFNSI